MFKRPVSIDIASILIRGMLTYIYTHIGAMYWNNNTFNVNAERFIQNNIFCPPCFKAEVCRKQIYMTVLLVIKLLEKFQFKYTCTSIAMSGWCMVTGI